MASRVLEFIQTYMMDFLIIVGTLVFVILALRYIGKENFANFPFYTTTDSSAPKNLDGELCNINRDCKSQRCVDGVCQCWR